MTNHLEERIEEIALAGFELFAEEFEDHTGRLNVVTIYAKDDTDYQLLKTQLNEEGEMLEDDFYILSSPLTIKHEIIALIRLLHLESEHIQIGECDFALDNWLEFESQNKKKKWVEIFDEEEFHMIRYADPVKSVFLAFTNPPVSVEESESILDDDADGVESDEDYE